jgi:dissimilatory sulfite reductase (desulfoviridin) alpha/beta subunit
MKYDEEMYLDSGFYAADEDMGYTEEKIVKCRKPHICANCQTEIPKGDKALYEFGFLDGKPAHCYTCLHCIEDWLEESGQVETKDGEQE